MTCEGRCGGSAMLPKARFERPGRTRWDCPVDGSWASVADDGALFAACWYVKGGRQA